MAKEHAQQNTDFDPRVGDTVSCDSLHYTGRGRIVERLPFEQMSLVEGIDKHWQAWFYDHELQPAPDKTSLDVYPEHDGGIFIV